MGKNLDQQATLAGIAADYIDAHGERRVIAPQTRHKLLAAMQPKTLQPEVAPLPVVKLCYQDNPVILPLAGKGKYHWVLQLEDTSQQQGVVAGGSNLSLPGPLPQGYHQLTLTQEGRQWGCRLIIAPRRCYEPAALLAGKKLWGACIQLYTLRSQNNWGIGDFGDLRAMITKIAARGAAFVGLNPIHALYPARPENASPYSPSSRRYLNVIYIDVNAVADFQLSQAAQQWWQQPATQQLLALASSMDWVDYSTVMHLKLTALKLAFSQFQTRDKNDALQQAFAQFVTIEGNSLYQQATFDALHAHLFAQDSSMWGWPEWPAEYRQADSAAVAAFCQQHADDVMFYQWLQWLAASQLAACFEQSQQCQMPIGLYRDLAVGVTDGGAETWGERELYCLNVSVGAPPDPLGPIGQNWGLVPMDPHAMVARAYQPFIDLLRANMAQSGALRIDHVMAFLRLWWIPQGETADQGGYVKYPIDDLLALLALESQRHRCMVIGEDLGTVPTEIIRQLHDSGIYSYKVLYFEHDADHRFRAPQNYPVQAMATLTTHDLPTLRGYWQGGDLRLGDKLGLYPDLDVFNGLLAERDRVKRGLLTALYRHADFSEVISKKAALPAMNRQLNLAMQRYLAGSACALLGLQPEDWLDMAEPVNVPGTSDQYPNWRRKLSHTVEEMFDDQQIEHLLTEINQCRTRMAAG